MEAMNLIVPQIENAGATLFGVSPQTVQQSFFMADQHRLNFSLLSDINNDLARQFGLVYRVPDYQQSVYRSAFINLPFINGSDSWELPVPATYIVDREGIIRYSSINPDYSQRPEPADVLDALLQM
jgi:peroxiredoxin